MSKTFRMAVSLITLFVMGALSACNAAPAEPTIDPNMIFTAAAQTVQAQLTVAAALNPTATATPEPTQTSMPTVAPTLALTPATNPVSSDPAAATTPLVIPTQSLALATLAPSATAAAAVDSSLIDRGEIVDQDPDDGETLGNDVDFDMTWTIKNTGTTTWTPGTGNCEGGYYLAFGGGDRIGSGFANWYCIRDTVAPGGTAQFVVDMKTSGTDGKYNSIWCLMNGQKKCIRMMDVTINVN
ncbi:MAG: hypothetical protein LWX83_08410 [Anaerolineae bacterium]|nr:hypothetical protein [Anaerolineae bacterium]